MQRAQCAEVCGPVCSCTVGGKQEEGVVFMWVALPQDCSVLHWPSSPISLSCSLIWHPASCCSARRAGCSVGGVRRGVCVDTPHPRNWTSKAAGLPINKGFHFFPSSFNYFLPLSPTGGLCYSRGCGSGRGALVKVSGSIFTLRSPWDHKPNGNAASSVYKCVDASRSSLMTMNAALPVGLVFLV